MPENYEPNEIRFDENDNMIYNSRNEKEKNGVSDLGDSRSINVSQVLQDFPL